MSDRTCRDVRADLSAYLDGDLGPEATRAIGAHLEGCAACRAELEQLRLTVVALRRLPELPAPAGILSGVRARLHPEPWYRRLLDGRQWRLGLPIGALATILVVIGVALFQARYPGQEKMTVRDESAPALAPTAPVVPAEPPAPAVSVRPSVPAAPSRPAVPTKAPAAAPAVPAPQRLEPVAKKVAAMAKESAAPRDNETTSAAGSQLQKKQKDAVNLPASGAESRSDLRRSEAPAAAPAAVSAAAPAAAPLEQARQAQPIMRAKAESLGATAPAAAPAAPSAAATSGALRDADALTYAPPKQKEDRTRILCLLAPEDGVEAISELLRREGADAIIVSELGPDAIREAFAPHRERLGAAAQPTRGWTVTASYGLQPLDKLLDTLAQRRGLQLLERPGPLAAGARLAERQLVRLTLLR